MSLSAAAERLRADRAEALNRCPVGQLRLTLSESDRDELDDLMRLHHTEMTTGIILDALRASGITVTFDDTAMQSHRRTLRGGQGCKCQV